MTNASTLPAPPDAVALDGGVEAGITWATCDAPFYGAVNGYVLLPDAHPWRHLDTARLTWRRRVA